MPNRIRRIENGRYSFFCPGCQEMHQINSEWQFNNNLEYPTFIPSLLIRSGHYTDHWKKGDDCWCTYNVTAKEPAPFKCRRCHSYITNGQIKFLSDCSHSLAGKTVPMREEK